MKEPRTRKEKISFLKDVITGKRDASALLVEYSLIIVSMEDENGNLKHLCRGSELTAEEYERLSKRITKNIVVEYE